MLQLSFQEQVRRTRQWFIKCLVACHTACRVTWGLVTHMGEILVVILGVRCTHKMCADQVVARHHLEICCLSAYSDGSNNVYSRTLWDKIDRSITKSLYFWYINETYKKLNFLWSYVIKYIILMSVWQFLNLVSWYYQLFIHLNRNQGLLKGSIPSACVKNKMYFALLY